MFAAHGEVVISVKWVSDPYMRDENMVKLMLFSRVSRRGAVPDGRKIPFSP